jgi:hypothetical protein
MRTLLAYELLFDVPGPALFARESWRVATLMRQRARLLDRRQEGVAAVSRRSFLAALVSRLEARQ